MKKFLVLGMLFFLATSKLIAQTDSVIVVFGDTRTLVLGNTRTNHDVNQIISRKIISLKPVAVFHTGDIVYNGLKKSAWKKFTEFFAPVIDSSRFYPCYGNHELRSKSVLQLFSLPNNSKWYSVDVMHIHFVVIDNFSKYTIGSEQYQWLENDLKNYDKNKFCVVIMHLPVYTSGPHKTHPRKIRKNLVPLFEKYGVDVVFSGHNHCYEKAFSNGIYYITTAGGGAPMYPKVRNIAESQVFLNEYHFCKLQTKGNTLYIQAIDTSLRVIDQFEISK